MCQWADRQREDGRDERNQMVEEILAQMRTKLTRPRPDGVTIRWSQDLGRYVEVR